MRFSIRPKSNSKRAEQSSGSRQTRTLSRSARLSLPLLSALALVTVVASTLLVAAWAKKGTPQTDVAPQGEMTRVDLKSKDVQLNKDGSPMREEAVEPGTAELITAATYPFAAGTTPLEDMSTGTTQLVGASADDTASVVTNIGFEFWMDGTRFTQFSANANGLMKLGSVVVDSGANGRTNNFATANDLPKIAAYWDDLCTAANGKVHFKVVGSAPNRRLVVEWLNERTFGTSCTDGLAIGTWQVWIYESAHATTPGVIQFVYGALGANSATNGGYSNGIGSSATSFGSITTTSDTVSYAASANAQVNAVGSPKSYTFTPNVPTAPTGLNFTSVAPTSMTLNWTDTSSNEAGFAIYRSTDGVNYTFLTQAAANAISFGDSGLVPSTNYFYQVYAVSEGALSSALSGSQSTAAPGNITCNGAGGVWSSAGSWTGGIPSAGDNVTIGSGCTITIDTAAAALGVTVQSGGVLQYEQTTARTLAVGLNVTVDAGGTLQSSAAGTVTTHVLSVAGNLVNNGTLDFSTNADTAGAGITFTGAGNTSFSGTGATTDIRIITMNKGTNNTAIMELMPSNFTVRGVTTDTVVGGWLVMTNGTIKVSGTFTGTSRVFSAAAYTIPTTAGFWLNNANYTVAAQAGNAVNNGLFRMTQGIFNQGTLVTHSFRGGTGAVFNIEGGTINCASQFSPQNAVSYTQSGGTVNVAIVGNSQSNFGSFELFSTTATFNMSGGVINVVQASTGSTQIDYQNRAVSTVTGGTLNIGTAATVTKFTFTFSGNVPALVIDNTTNNKSLTSFGQVNYHRNTLINPGTSLTINGFVNLIIGQTFTNNGTLNATAAGTRFYFLGTAGLAQTYNGSGTVTAPLTQFEVDNPLGVTIDPAVNQIIANRYNNFAGGLTGSGKLTLGNGGTTTAVVQLGVTGVTSPITGFDVPPVFNAGTGGVNLLYAPELTGRTTGNEMPPSRTLNLISLTNPNPITISGGDVTLTSILVTANNNALQLGAGRLITGANTVIMPNAASTVTRTTGYVEGGLRKNFSAAASKLFEVGTANGYSPVTANVTAGTFPSDFTVRPVQTVHPAFGTPSKAITRYWTLTESGDITADLTFNYLDPTDIPGTVTEANLLLYKYNGAFSAQTATIDTTANTALITGVSDFSDWTLAEPAALLTPGTLQFSAPTYTIGEEGVQATIGVTRTGGSDGTVTADYATVAGGTATGAAACGAGVDYVNTSGTVTFLNGETSQSFNIPLCGDTTDEPDETVNLALTNPTGGATLGAQNTAVLTLTDDDVAFVGPVTVTATAGTPGPTDYATVKAAFDAINAGTHQGAITIWIVASTTEGTTPATLNSSGAGSASYTSVNLYPINDGLTITGNPASGFGVIQLKGADNVTLDGDNPNTAGTNRNLTINNTNVATDIAGSVIRIATAATVVTSADNNTIKNLNLNGNVTGGNSSLITATTGSSNSSFVIYAGGNGGATATDAPTALTSVTANTAVNGTTINNLTIDNNALNQAARAIVFNGAVVGVSTGVSITNNTIGATGSPTPATPPYTSPATTVYTKGIWVAGTGAATVTGNTINNILSYVGTTMTTIEMVSPVGTPTISNNTISNLANNGTVSIAKGILISNSANAYTVSNNSISNIQTLAGSSGTDAIEATNGPSGGTIERNTITTVYGRAPGTFGAYGINLTAGTGIVIRNNFISDINMDMTGGAAFSTQFSVHGIRITGGTNHKIYHNSVNLFGSLLGTATNTILTSCFTPTATTITGMDVRNNIFSNTMTGGTTSIAHVSMFLPPSATVAMNLTLNNNAYYANTTAGNAGIAHVGTTYTAVPAGPTTFAGLYTVGAFDPSSTSPNANFRAYTSTLSAAGTNDNASFAVGSAAPFTSNTNLHIPAATVTRLESGGAAGTGVTVDIDNETRNVTTPDIGGDEFAGTPPAANDIAANAFITPTNGSLLSTGSVISPQASFTNAGTATQTNVNVQFTITGPGGYNYTNSQVIATLSAGGTTTVTFAAAPAFTTPGAYTMAAAVTTPDANGANDTINGGFTVAAPLSGSYTVGMGGDFTSLTNPGGVFAAINGLGATSNITINVTSDLSGETGTIALNQVAGGFTVLIQPSGGAARTITGTATPGLINLNGADGVTINGLNSGGNSLLIRNTGTGATVRMLADASNNTVQNTTLEGASTTGVVLISTGTTTGNDNVAITNNTIRDRTDAAGVPTSLVSSVGTSTAIANSGLNISNNTLINFATNGVNIGVGTETLTCNSNDISQTANRATVITGINVVELFGTSTISQNQIHGLRSSALGGTFLNTAGIFVLDSRSLTISRNRLYDFPALAGATGRIVGIEFEGEDLSPSAAVIVNNMVSIVTSVATAQSVMGIFDFAFGGNTTTIDHNSIYIGGTASGAANSWALIRGAAAPTNFTARNNIAFNNRTGGTGSHFAGGDESANGGTFVSDFNFFAGTGATPANFMDYGTTVVPVSFATWQAGPPARDANSIAGVASSFNADDIYINPNAGDLHLEATAPSVRNNGTTLGSVTIDYDGDTRPSGAGVERGADEIVEVVATTDLAITKTDGVTTVTAGGSVTYTITASNAGPAAAPGATVTDTFVAALGTPNWTCVGAGGGTCTAMGMGNINDTVNLPVGGSVTYTVNATVSPSATGSLVNTASVDPPMGITDTNPGNDDATDTDTILLSADLAITKTDGVTSVSPGGSTTYTIVASNSGPSNVTGATVTDTLPMGIASASWTCVGAGGGTCTAMGMGSINDTVNLPAGGSVTYTLNATISMAAVGTIVNTASVDVPMGVTDPNGGNDDATDTDTVNVLPGMSISDARVTEGDSGNKNMTFTVTFNGGGAASVHYHTVDGTAQADVPPGPAPEVAHGNDYVPEQNGIISFGANPNPEGGSQTRTFNIIIHGDTFKEPNEFFSVVLDQPIGATITDNTGYGVIVDEDRAYVADLDRDRKTDISVFRPSDRNWYTLSSQTGNPIYLNYGLSTDKPVPGDYDGDGTMDYAVRRPGSQNTWWVQFSHDFSLHPYGWGIDSDLSVQADYDGDDKTDVAVFRDGIWYILRSSDNTQMTVYFGQAGDVPVPGDFDGDGKADFTVFRSGTWFTLRSSNNTTVSQPWGAAGDKPVAGDFDGDGRFDYTVFRNGTWYILKSLSNSLAAEFWGQAGDLPVVGDYDGDGTSDVAVFRPSAGVWYILRSSDRTVVGVAWGLNGDIPIPGAYQP